MQQFLQFIILTFIYSSTCFGRPHAHHQELNNWFYLRIVVIAVLLFVVRAGCQDNKLEKLLHLIGDLFELYDDARTYKL